MYFPTHSRRMFLISLCFITWGLTSCSTSAQSEAVGKVENAPSDVVRDYVNKAGSGKFDELAGLISPNPGGNTAKPKEESRPSTAVGNGGSKFTIAPDPTAVKDAYMSWLQRDFPKSIMEQKLIIKEIKNDSVEGDQARVHVLFRNDQKTDLLGWVFVMTKIDGKWLIKDITTPGDISN